MVVEVAPRDERLALVVAGALAVLANGHDAGSGIDGEALSEPADGIEADLAAGALSQQLGAAAVQIDELVGPEGHKPLHLGVDLSRIVGNRTTIEDAVRTALAELDLPPGTADRVAFF